MLLDIGPQMMGIQTDCHISTKYISKVGLPTKYTCTKVRRELGGATGVGGQEG